MTTKLSVEKTEARLERLLRAEGNGYILEQFDRLEPEGRVHDWRNYLPEELRKVWGSLTRREQIIVAYFCAAQADHEEWD